jgi:hypothetical protein
VVVIKARFELREAHCPAIDKDSRQGEFFGKISIAVALGDFLE